MRTLGGQMESGGLSFLGVGQAVGTMVGVGGGKI